MKARGPTTQRILLVFLETKTGTEIRKVENRKGHEAKGSASWKRGVASRRPEASAFESWSGGDALDTCHRRNAQIKDANGWGRGGE